MWGNMDALETGVKALPAIDTKAEPAMDAIAEPTEDASPRGPQRQLNAIMLLAIAGVLVLGLGPFLGGPDVRAVPAEAAPGTQ